MTKEEIRKVLELAEVIVNLGRGEYGFKAGDKVIVQTRRK